MNHTLKRPYRFDFCLTGDNLSFQIVSGLRGRGGGRKAWVMCRGGEGELFKKFVKFCDTSYILYDNLIYSFLVQLQNCK